jgi:rhamnosyltransferase
MTELQPEDVAAVVVLYRPRTDTVFNIASYAPDVARVIAVDNTESPDATIVSALQGVPGLRYIPMGRNSGLGAAIDTGVAAARTAGFGWVLTMDQDSTPGRRMIFELSRCAASCPGGRPLGLVSPILHLENGPDEPAFEGCRDALTTITSGSLLNVDAWAAVGGLDESLFIDQVDHEYCLRLHLNGFAVLECGAAWLSHRMGEMQERRLLGPVYVSNHAPLRRYYITRNRLAVSRRYRTDFPEFLGREMRAMRHELLKVVLLEDHKIEKLVMSWRGYRDYRRGVTGPYRGSPRSGGHA